MQDWLKAPRPIFLMTLYDISDQGTIKRTGLEVWAIDDILLIGIRNGCVSAVMI